MLGVAFYTASLSVIHYWVSLCWVSSYWESLLSPILEFKHKNWSQTIGYPPLDITLLGPAMLPSIFPPKFKFEIAFDKKLDWFVGRANWSLLLNTKVWSKSLQGTNTLAFMGFRCGSAEELEEHNWNKKKISGSFPSPGRGWWTNVENIPKCW